MVGNGAAPDLLAPKPHLPVASPRKLPNRTTIKELGWRLGAPRGDVPRDGQHGPPRGRPMVNGVKTDMVNERLIGWPPVPNR